MLERKRFPGDPNHIYEIRCEKKHQYCYCLNTKDGYQCSYKKRIDHLLDHIKTGKIHQCQYSVPNYTLDNFINPLKASIYSTNMIDEKIAYLIGKRNLPLDLCCSKEFSDLINTAISFGMQLSMKKIKTIFITRQQET